MATAPDDRTVPPGTSLTHRLAQGASIYVVSLAIGKGLTVALQIVLGRWLGPSRYGLYALGYSIVGFFSWVAVLGLNHGVLRYCAIYSTQRKSDNVRAILWQAIELAGVASVLTAALLIAGSHLIAEKVFTPSFASVLAAFALTLPFVAFVRIAGNYFQSLHDIYRLSVLHLLAGPALNIVLLALAIGIGWGLEGAVGAYVLCCVGTAVLAVYYLTKEHGVARSGSSTVTAAHPQLMRYSLVLMFAGLSYQVILRAPQVLLGHLGSSAQVGVFSAGASFALGFGFMTSTFLQPAMPMMVELDEKKHNDDLHRLYQNSTRWTLAVVTPIFLLLALFHNEVMRLFGRNFSAAGPILVAMSLGWLAYYGKGPGSSLLQMTGRQYLDLLNTFGVAVLTVTANYLVIPHYGAIGAAVATAGSIAVWALAEFLEIWFLYGLAPWSSGAQRIILGSVITTVVTIALRTVLPWEILLLAAMSIYGAFYFGFCLEADDLHVIAAGTTRLKVLLRL